MQIFIAKLSAGTTSDDLRELFEGYGAVDSAKVIMDRETGNSKRFGFVEMPNEEEARKAISDLQDVEYDSSRIVVKEAEPRESRPPKRNNFKPRGDFNSRPRY
jgi:cold-inducible RNA-binding protein